MLKLTSIVPKLYTPYLPLPLLRMLIQRRNIMKLRQLMKNLVKIPGALGQELKKAYHELITSIRSIDRDRIPDPKSVIRELKKILLTIATAGKVKLGELWEAIQDLKDAIAKIGKASMPDMQGVFRSIGEWWWDLKSLLQKLKEAIPSIREVRDLIEAVRKQHKGAVPLDKGAEILAGLGVPGLVLVFVMAASPWFGAAAITSALAAIGPFGMLGGIATLLVLTFIASHLAAFGFEQVFQAVLIKLIADGKTKKDILQTINGYPISKELKRKLRGFIEKYCEENDETNDLEDNKEKNSSEQ